MLSSHYVIIFQGEYIKFSACSLPAQVKCNAYSLRIGGKYCPPPTHTHTHTDGGKHTNTRLTSVNSWLSDRSMTILQLTSYQRVKNFPSSFKKHQQGSHTK